MNVLKLRLRQGFTVVELVLSAAMLVVLGFIAVGVLALAVRGERMTTEEFALQSSSRIMLDHLSHTIRYATAVFIMPESSFNSTNIDTSLDFIPYMPGGFLSERWNYFGILDGTIVRYIWTDSGAVSGHIRREVFAGTNEYLEFNLLFSQIDATDMNDTLVEFRLTVDNIEHAINEIDIPTAADAMSAMQVVDWSSPVSPGRAIAYRLDELPRDMPVARVVLILDVSGSMRSGLLGNNVANWETNPNSRMYMLRRATELFITTLLEADNIEITIIPYSTTANFANFAPNFTNNPAHGGMLIMQNFSALMHSVFGGEYTFVTIADYLPELMEIASTLPAFGATNIADGLRRAYWALVDAPADPLGRDVREYVILMTDGIPNLVSMVTQPGAANITIAQDLANRPGNFFTGRGDIPLAGITYGPAGNAAFPDMRHAGGVAHLNRALTQDYANFVVPGQRIFANKILSRTSDTFFVAFSSTVVNIDGSLPAAMQELVNALKVGTPYAAADFAQLLNAFDEIATSIVTDMWHASGPNLAPPVGGP